MKTLYTLIAALVLLLGAGCSSTKDAAKTTTKKVEYELVTMPSGLKYYDMVIGKGKTPKLNQKVTIHFKIYTEDNNIIEDTYKYDQPLTFKIGNEEVIKGLEEGLLTMKPGGKRKLIIPPELGFGNRTVRTVPANTNLICEVELLKAE